MYEYPDSKVCFATCKMWFSCFLNRPSTLLPVSPSFFIAVDFMEHNKCVLSWRSFRLKCDDNRFILKTKVILNCVFWALNCLLTSFTIDSPFSPVWGRVHWRAFCSIVFCSVAFSVINLGANLDTSLRSVYVWLKIRLTTLRGKLFILTNVPLLTSNL